MLIQLGFADIYTIEQGLLDPPSPRIALKIDIRG